MKITALLIFAVLFQVSAASRAQITIVNKQITLERVFKEIQKQAGYDFFYNNDLIRDLSPVSLNLKNASVTTVLDASLKGLPFQYKVVENSVVITAKPITKNEPKQVPAKVEIRVSDEFGKPMSGVTVLSKTKVKTLGMTNKEGVFILSDAEEGEVLYLSFLGYKPKEVVVGTKSLINVKMELLDSKLSEVQISTGYQYIKPEQSTGSVTIMSNKEYDSRINTIDFLTALQSRIPGLLINNDIEFEGNSLFQIRGISTINGNKQPLIVIDGFPTELSLANINPNEIESVTVLRDAAAATVYGVRASNGVIVIERKKAKIGKPNIAYRATFSLKPKENYDLYRWDKDASNTVIEYTKDANKNIGASAWMLMTMPTIGSLMPNTVPYTILARKAAGLITAEEADSQLEALRLYNNTSDYGDLFLQNATTQTHNLDISGGTENATYYITAQFNDNALNQIKNGGNRIGLSARTNLKLNKRLSVELNTNFQEARDFSAPVPGINSFYPYERFVDQNGNPAATYSGSKTISYYNDIIMNLGLLDNMYYPLQEVDLVENKNHSINNRFIANFKYDIGKGFNLNFGGVYETSTTNTRRLANENSAEVRQIVNRYTESGTGGLVLNVPKGDYLKQGMRKTEGYTVRAQLNYNKQINTDHAINLISGLEVRRLVSSSSSSANFGYSDQTLLQRPVNFMVIQNSSFVSPYGRSNPAVSYEGLFAQTYEENRFLSGYFNAVYNYKGKYSLTGSTRIDQSNLFGSDPKNRYKPTWSVGAGWNIDREKFIQPLTWVNSMKMRAALGFNGNIAKNVLPEVIASSKLNGFDSSLNSLGLFSPANSRLRWEQTFNFNLGLDYQIFKNITGNIDYYLKRSIDILASNQVDPTRGVTSAIINESTIRNGGLEIGLHADWISRRNFNWNTGFVFSKNMSKILKVYNENVPPKSESYRYAVGTRTNYLQGYAVGGIFNYRYAGVDNTGKVLIYDKDGNAKKFDEDDKGIDDVDYVGSSIPAYNLGLSNRVDIGNFYAFAMINYFGGFKARIPMPVPSEIRPLTGASNYWRKPGDENIPNVMPAINIAGHYDYLRATDRFIVDGTYFTLGDLTVAYSFRKSSFVKRAKLSNLELRAQASNIYTVALNKHNYSVATGSYEKSYLTPTYSAALVVNF